MTQGHFPAGEWLIANPTRTGFIRPVDLSLLPTDDSFSCDLQFTDEVIIWLSGAAADMAGPPPHYHNEMDQFLYVLEGAMELTLGRETYELHPGAIAHIPAGTPHKWRNIASVPLRHLEVMAPGFRMLDTFLTFMGPDDVWAPGGSVVHEPPLDEWEQIGEGIKIRVLSEPSGKFDAALPESKELSWFVPRIDPGHGFGSGFHYHKFHQFYYVTEGTLGIDIGLESFEAGPHTLVVIPAGAVHRNYVVGSNVESHIHINVPPPTAAEDEWDIPVSFGPPES
jgi:mannose-6-phosphate isomerase-like protein (cupin superfamily)